MYSTPESRWRAVQSRDQFAASAFIYAVKTTRIFCRPTCPARLARRANVLFFDDCAAAAAASFRPCKRCRPEEAGVVSPARKTVEAAQVFMREQRGQVTLEQLAKHLKLSSRHLHHVFSKNAGCTPAAYATWVRQAEQDKPSSALVTKESEDIFLPSPDLFNGGIPFDSTADQDWLTATSNPTPLPDMISFGEVDWQSLDLFCSSMWPEQPATPSAWPLDLQGYDETSICYARLPIDIKLDDFLFETASLRNGELAPS